MRIRLRDFRIFSWAVVLLAASSCKKPAELGGCSFGSTLDEYNLVWQDEFDGSSIDESKWSFDIGDGCDLGVNLCGWGNNELQYYTSRPENAYTSGGNLIIKARRENPLYLGQHQYTSARLKTKNKGDWKYGRIDVRAKMPLGQGMWSAAWMLPTDTVYGGWPKSGEIDIMEFLGHKPKNVLGTIHYGHDFWRYRSQSLDLENGTFASEFHVFTALWTDECIQFQMDGIDIGKPNTRSTTLPTTWPFDQKFHMILNLAIGGNLPGNPDASTTFPQNLFIDYVRVYEKK
jgi:beta-glucanase (GH16 family)